MTAPRTLPPWRPERLLTAQTQAGHDAGRRKQTRRRDPHRGHAVPKRVGIHAYQQRVPGKLPRALGKEEAARRIKERIASEKINKANVASVSKEVWNDPYNLDFAMTLFNYRVDGTLKIDDSEIIVNLNLPFVAMMVKGMIEDQMKQQMDIMLA